MPNTSQMNGDQLMLALLIAIIGACVLIFGHWVRLRDNQAQDAARLRDHSLLMLTWATGLATDPDPVKAGAGVAALGALARSTALGVATQEEAAVVAESIASQRNTQPTVSAA